MYYKLFLNKQNPKNDVIQKINEETDAFITKIDKIAIQLNSYWCKNGKDLVKNAKTIEIIEQIHKVKQI